MSSKGSILVVGSSDNLKLVADALTADGYQVLPADNIELALAAAAANSPELILLAAKIEGVDGLEVSRQLCARKASWDIPIILIRTSGKTYCARSTNRWSIKTRSTSRQIF